MPCTAAIDFNASSLELARALIGVVLRVDRVGGRIGHAYVYRSYGLHWCLNFACREVGHGAGVLIRAMEPTHGLELMRARRGAIDDRLLCAGPGRLAQALGITNAHDGLPLDAAPFELQAWTAAPDVVVGTRIGISKAAGMPWRFGLRGSGYVSRRFA